VNGSAAALDKLREIVRHEFSGATEHSEAFVYFCEDEARFAPALPPEMLNAGQESIMDRWSLISVSSSKLRNLTRFKSCR
jgi:hypothetical protein